MLIFLLPCIALLVDGWRGCILFLVGILQVATFVDVWCRNAPISRGLHVIAAILGVSSPSSSAVQTHDFALSRLCIHGGLRVNLREFV